MREIKFRAWDKKDNKMFTLEDVKGNLGLYFNYTTRTYEDEGKLNDRFIQMQYTGLNDIHGQEVCEGDIAKYYSIIQVKEVLAEVVFKKGCFVINEYYLGNKKRFEVMGNIYENPELLEVK